MLQSQKVIVMVRDKYQRSRLLYIFEAMFEYLISIMVTGSFLATIASELGISDSLTGIISSFISLGCLFQLLAIALKRRYVKRLVTAVSVFNQLLFMLLYILPLGGGKKHIGTAVFVGAIFLAYLFYNMVHPLKINWFMSLVDDNIRGRFTANKEIISLICGMLFTLGMGTLVDYYKNAGNIKMAFILCAAVIFVLMLLHTMTMVFSVEKPTISDEKGEFNPIKQFATVFRNKNVRKINLLFIIWYSASYSTIPFYGTYMIKELGFSLKFVSVLSIVYSAVRILVSKFWGRYADRKSFAIMIRLCFLVMSIGFLSNVFAIPSTGKFIFALYNIFHGIAMGGINSALTNLVFDYVPADMRSDAIAMNQATSGLVGFIATLIASPLVAFIQGNGNSLFGIKVYAQQVTSLIAFGFTIAAILYVSKVIIKDTPMHVQRIVKLNES